MPILILHLIPKDRRDLTAGSRTNSVPRLPRERAGGFSSKKTDLHPEKPEQSEGVSKDGNVLRAMVRDASLRDAPHHEVRSHSAGCSLVSAV